MNKAIAYCRVSSREQAEGYSLDAQYEKINLYAEKQNLKVYKSWRVSESAKKEGRKAFNEMIDFLKKSDIRVVIFEKIDRVARNFRDIVKVQELIDDYDKEFHFVRENIVLHRNSRSSEKLNFDLQAVLAKNYINNLSDEVKKGFQEKLRQGGWPGSAPLGYKNDANTKNVIIDDSQAHFVKKAFEMYATELFSLDRICEQLHKQGFVNKFDKKVSKSKLHVTLQNPFYIGKMIWKGETYQGKHKPLIEPELFYKVQEIFSNRKRPRKDKHNFLFSGLIKCGVCGSSYTTEIQKGKYTYYRCTEHYKKHSHNYWREEKLEKEIIKVLDMLIIPENIYNDVKNALKNSHTNEIEFHNEALKTLQQKLDRIQKRKDQLYDDKLDGLISKEVYLEKAKKEQENEDSLLNLIKKHKKANQSYFETGLKILELCKMASYLYKQGTREEKREILQFVFSNFTITNERFDYTAKSPFSEIIKMQSRSEWSG